MMNAQRAVNYMRQRGVTITRLTPKQKKRMRKHRNKALGLLT